MEPIVSIIVVSYNTREMTLACLDSIARATTSPHEIIVIDNESSDGSADAIRAGHPGVRLIEPGENLGFARANNAGVAEARGGLVLLLNPDTLVLDGAIDTLIACARERADAAIFGGRTLRDDRTLDPVCAMGAPTLWGLACEGVGLNHVFARTRLFDPVSLGRWERDTTRFVPVVSGAFLMIRKPVWEALGGMDARFFLYCEEVDLCMRAADAGHRCLFCADAAIIHYGSASQRVRADRLVRSQRARAQLIRKHWSGPRRTLGIFFLGMRVWTRAMGYRAAASVRRGSRETASQWIALWRRRSEWLAERAGERGGA